MLDAFREKREWFAGGLIALVGAGIIGQGVKLRLGSLTNMGPGYFPVLLGILLVVIGAIIAATGRGSSSDGGKAVGFSLRGGVCILLGVVAFIVLGQAFGFVAATFSSIFISALGDNAATLRGSLALAAGLTVAGAIVFTYLLHIPFQLFHWVSL